MTTTKTIQCDHEDTTVIRTRGFDVISETCDDCGEEIERDDEEPDDGYYQRQLERAAGVGEPDRRYYDGGRLIDPDRRR